MTKGSRAVEFRLLEALLLTSPLPFVSAADLHLGVAAGVNWGDLSSGPTPGDVFEPVAFPIVALAFERNGGHHTSLLFDLGWIRKGCRITSLKAPGKAQTDYLEATAMLALHSARGDELHATIRPYLAAGPSFAIRIHEDHQGSAAGFLSPGQGGSDEPASRWLDAGIAGAAGTQVQRSGLWADCRPAHRRSQPRRSREGPRAFRWLMPSARVVLVESLYPEESPRGCTAIRAP